MVRTKRAIPVAVILMTCVTLTNCKSAPPKPPKPPEPQVVKLTVRAAADVNPDAQSRPSPIVVRIYQLKDDATFKDAEFFALYDKEEGTLAASMISRQEFEVAPGAEKVVDYQVSLDARFLGVAAAYRNIRNSVWRAELGSQDRGLAALANKKKMTVVAGRASIALSVE